MKFDLLMFFIGMFLGIPIAFIAYSIGVALERACPKYGSKAVNYLLKKK